jgi:hypothetical protein
LQNRTAGPKKSIAGSFCRVGNDSAYSGVAELCSFFKKPEQTGQL